MPVILPFAAWVLLAAALRGRGIGLRRALLSAAVWWAVLLTAITEALSLVGRLDFAGVAAAWTLASLGLAAGLRRRPESASATAPPAVDRGGRDVRVTILVGGVCIILALVAAAALLGVPNTGDSLAYHMPRVMHWIQNAGVGHYPTGIHRQLYLAPWSEFAILHLQLLSGGDRFAGLVQFAAMAGSLAGVSLIAAHLGGGAAAQALAALIAATIPMGLLQGASTQNDFVVAFWLVCFATVLLDPGRRPSHDRPWAGAAEAGAAIGLAVLTKGTAYIFAPPFLLWYAVRMVRGLGPQAWRPALTATAAALALNAGHFGRNWDVYGTPLGPSRDEPGAFGFANRTFTPAVLASNVVRNVALHLATPWVAVNRTTEKVVKFVHKTIGIEVDDERTTWTGTYFGVPLAGTFEDNAGNLLHVLLVPIAGAVLVGTRRLRGSLCVPYAAAVTSAFLLFCLLLAWQPWHSRLHLFLFVAAAPWIAVTLTDGLPKSATDAVAGVLLAGALPFLLFAAGRPLVGEGNVFAADRTSLYFRHGPDGCEADYQRVADHVKSGGHTTVGLPAALDPEYPLWVLLADAPAGAVRIEYLDPPNPSAALSERPQFRGFRPEALIFPGPGPADGYTWHGIRFVRTLATPTLSVWERPAGTSDRITARQATLPPT